MRRCLIRSSPAPIDCESSSTRTARTPDRVSCCAGSPCRRPPPSPSHPPTPPIHQVLPGTTPLRPTVTFPAVEHRTVDGVPWCAGRRLYIRPPSPADVTNPDPNLIRSVSRTVSTTAFSLHSLGGVLASDIAVVRPHRQHHC